MGIYRTETETQEPRPPTIGNYEAMKRALAHSDIAESLKQLDQVKTRSTENWIG